MLKLLFGDGQRKFSGAQTQRKQVASKFFVVLFNRLTVGGLLVASLLLAADEFYGDPIDCKVDGVKPEIMDKFCWTTGTYTVREYFRPEYAGVVAYPGVGHYDEHLPLNRQFHQYYQWVFAALLLSAMRFYLPLYLFKSLVDNGKMAEIVQAVQVSNEIFIEAAYSRRI